MMTTYTAALTLTVQEARDILRSHGFLSNVPLPLVALALETFKANDPIVVYEPMDFENYDGRDVEFEEDEDARQVARAETEDYSRLWADYS